MQTAVARRRVLMSPDEIERAIARMAHQIVEPEDVQSGLLLIGIRRGGEALARRLASKIARDPRHAARTSASSTSTSTATTTSRASCRSRRSAARSPGKTVVLVDDVLYTGRTVRAALDAVTDLGRPNAIRLAVLVDRGLRELPIQADYVGKSDPDQPARAHRRDARAAAFRRRRGDGRLDEDRAAT